MLRFSLYLSPSLCGGRGGDCMTYSLHLIRLREREFSLNTSKSRSRPSNRMRFVPFSPDSLPGCRSRDAHSLFVWINYRKIYLARIFSALIRCISPQLFTVIDKSNNYFPLPGFLVRLGLKWQPVKINRFEWPIRLHRYLSFSCEIWALIFSSSRDTLTDRVNPSRFCAQTKTKLVHYWFGSFQMNARNSIVSLGVFFASDFRELPFR